MSGKSWRMFSAVIVLVVVVVAIVAEVMLCEGVFIGKRLRELGSINTARPAFAVDVPSYRTMFCVVGADYRHTPEYAIDP
jgi:hypothetical protein